MITTKYNHSLQKIYSIAVVALFLATVLGGLAKTAYADGVLLIEPVLPAVEVGQKIILSVVSETSGTLTWTTTRGQIEGTGATVTYVAPEEAGIYAVTVLDDKGAGAVRVNVVPKGSLKPTFLPENAVWEVFTNRSTISSFSRSVDGKTLWVGTNGGLEQRDAFSGELLRVFTTNDGLLDNNVLTVLADSGGVWVGSGNGDLAYRNLTGAWLLFDLVNSKLPSPRVQTLLTDENGDLWIGTSNGLARRSAKDEWRVWTTDSGLPNKSVESLLLDGKGGLWVGTYQGGLAHLISANGDEWQVFNHDNSALPSNWVTALQADGNGGVWIGTWRGGLVQRTAAGEWHVFNSTTQPNFPDDRISALLADDNGGWWVTTYGGLVHFSASNEVTVFNTANSKLPSNQAWPLSSDGKGGIWVGTNDNGLVHRSARGAWDVVFNQMGEGLPSSWVTDLLPDGKGGMWVATSSLMGIYHGGLAHRSAEGSWSLFNTENPNEMVTAIATDGREGLWIGTDVDLEGKGSGLIHQTANGEKQVFNTENSKLPGNAISALLADGSGGVWIGTLGFNSKGSLIDPDNPMAIGSGLAHLKVNGEWEVFTTDNSKLPDNTINEIIADGQGGLWIGTGSPVTGSKGGLAHLSATGEWQVVNVTDHGLPSNVVLSLLPDGKNGWWLGTLQGGLAHWDAEDDWQVFNFFFNIYGDLLPEISSLGFRSNSKGDLPPEISSLGFYMITSLASDGRGGLWIGDGMSGLLHRSSEGEWVWFSPANSGLSSGVINKLVADDSGGLWVATGYGGLAHLSFSGKPQIVNKFKDESTSLELFMKQRAAIFIHPNTQGTGYLEEESLDFMATYAYHTFHTRGYDNDEIYFLSYKPDLDFNGDARADFNLVDAPVTMVDFSNHQTKRRDITGDDIRAAFNWAKQKGKLDSPLFVVFTGHGERGKLLLSKRGNDDFSGELFKAILDDYQKVSGNAVVVIVEACYSGSLVPILAGPNRVIISSTESNNTANYADFGRDSFIKFYSDQLRQGEDLRSALQAVKRNLSNQVPQLEDNAVGAMAQKLCLNGCFGSLPGVLTLTALTRDGEVNPEQPIDLSVELSMDENSIQGVWASILTPAVQYNPEGFLLENSPMVFLTPSPSADVNLRQDNSGKGRQWHGLFSEFSASGDYRVTFKARDNSSFISETKEPVILRVKLGKNQVELSKNYFEVNTNTLHLPAVTVGPDIYQVDLILRSGAPEQVLELSSYKLVTGTASVSLASYNRLTGTVNLPFVNIPNASGGMDTFSAELQLIPQTSPMQFRVMSQTKVELPK